MCNVVNTDWYNLHKQKLFGDLIFKTEWVLKPKNLKQLSKPTVSLPLMMK